MNDAPPPARSRFGARWRVALTVAFTMALVALLVHEFGGGEVVSAWRHASVFWIAVAFALSVGCVLLGALRWMLVLAAMHWRLSFGRALVVILATWPPAVMTPSRANEILRAVAVRDTVPVAAGTGSVLAEKAVDLAMLLALASLGAAARSMWRWSAAIGAILVLEAAVLALLAGRRRWLQRLPLLRRPGVVAQLFEAFAALARSPARLTSICAVSVAIRVATAAVMQALLFAVGTRVGLLDTLALWPAATLVGVAPLTLGGMGTRDAAFIYLLAQRGLVADPGAVFAATMGYSAVAVWSFALIGLPFMIREAVVGGRAAPAPERRAGGRPGR
jgi:uncharacterized membrane protein YbhN (UPF0104 family)